MKAKPRTHTTGCLIAHGADLFGDRWTLLILRDMMLFGKKTYGEFLASDEQIATNILASKLKSLEGAGVLTKRQDPENRRSHIYALTEKGLGLAPVILEIVRWSGGHLNMSAGQSKLYERIATDRDGLLADIRARAEKLA